jgi:hypothetical protein
MTGLCISVCARPPTTLNNEVILAPKGCNRKFARLQTKYSLAPELVCLGHSRSAIRGENNAGVIGEVEAIALEEGLSRTAAFYPK